MQALKKKLELQEKEKTSGFLGIDIFVPNDVQQERYNICLDCEHFYELLKNCKICGCVMPLKTKLKNVSCPINKWDKYKVNGSEK